MNGAKGPQHAPVQLNIFYNTTCLTGNELKIRRIKADADARLIHALFKMHPGESFTPFEVMEQLGYGLEKINSIRRAMTELSQAEPGPILIKTDIMRRGNLGATNHCWRLA
jgi:hypothetical protein